MTYLMTQMLICLSIAFLLGLIAGWLLCKIFGCGKKAGKPLEKKKTAGVIVDDIIEVDDGILAEDLVDDDMIVSAPIVEDAVVEGDVFDAPKLSAVNLDTAVDLDADGYSIETLEGVGPKTGDLFRNYGIETVGDYLRKLCQPADRIQAALDLEILEEPLHKWAFMSDFLRIEGVDHQFAELLAASGLKNVGELASQDSDALAAKLYEVNNAGKQLIAPVSPPAEQIQGWINQAQQKAPVVVF